MAVISQADGLSSKISFGLPRFRTAPGEYPGALAALRWWKCFLVPVRGYAKEGNAENVEFVGIAA